MSKELQHPRLEALRRLIQDDPLEAANRARGYVLPPKPQLQPRRLTRKIIPFDEYRLRKIREIGLQTTHERTNPTET